MESKICCKCKQTKPLSEFHLNRRNADGLHAYCKVCNIAQTRERNQREKERKSQNREQARQKWAANTISEKVCPACNVKKSATEFYPSARRADGLLPYCRECNKAIIKERKARLGELSRALKAD